MKCFNRRQPEIVVRIGKIIFNFGESHNEPEAVNLIIKSYINNSIFKLMQATVAIFNDQQDLGQLALEGATTGNDYPGVFTGVSATPDVEGVFNATLDTSDATGAVVKVNITPIAAGSGNLIVSATCAYTDAKGVSQTLQKSVTIPVTVTNEPAPAEDVNLVVRFGAPTPITPAQ